MQKWCDWWLTAKEFRQCKAVAKHKTFSVFMLTCMCFNNDPYRLCNGVEDTGLSPHKPTFFYFCRFFCLFSFCFQLLYVSRFCVFCTTYRAPLHSRLDYQKLCLEFINNKTVEDCVHGMYENNWHVETRKSKPDHKEISRQWTSHVGLFSMEWWHLWDVMSCTSPLFSSV